MKKGIATNSKKIIFTENYQNATVCPSTKHHLTTLSLGSSYDDSEKHCCRV